MYEFLNGSARLVGALERCADDPDRLATLTRLLYYCPDQLQQDMKALADFYNEARSSADDWKK